MLRAGRSGWASGFLLALAMGMQASAATMAPIRWYCGVDDGVADVLQCAQDRDPAFVDVVLESWSGLPHTYHAEFFSQGSVARLVRQRPQVYDGRNWSVPLLGPALDAGRLKELALAVMCGREPDCSVEMRASASAVSGR